MNSSAHYGGGVGVGVGGGGVTVAEEMNVCEKRRGGG